MAGPQAAAPYERYFDVTSPYGQRSGGQVTGATADNTSGGGLPAADLASQAGARLPGALEQLNKPGARADSGGAALPLDDRNSPFRSAYPDIPSGIFTGDFTRPESENLYGRGYSPEPYGTGYPADPVHGPLPLPDVKPAAISWGDWFNNLGRYTGNPFVSPAEGAEQPDNSRYSLQQPRMDPNTAAVFEQFPNADFTPFEQQQILQSQRAPHRAAGT